MLILGSVVGIGGLVGLIFSLASWQASGFGHLNYENALRLMAPSSTVLVLSCQAVFGCFFLSILGIRRTRRSSVGAPLETEPSDDREIAAVAHS